MAEHEEDRVNLWWRKSGMTMELSPEELNGLGAEAEQADVGHEWAGRCSGNGEARVVENLERESTTS